MIEQKAKKSEIKSLLRCVQYKIHVINYSITLTKSLNKFVNWLMGAAFFGNRAFKELFFGKRREMSLCVAYATSLASANQLDGMH